MYLNNVVTQFLNWKELLKKHIKIFTQKIPLVRKDTFSKLSILYSNGLDQLWNKEWLYLRLKIWYKKISFKLVKIILLEQSKLYNLQLRIKNLLKCQIYSKEYQKSPSKVLQIELNSIQLDRKRFLTNLINKCRLYLKNKEVSSSKVDSKIQA